MTSQKKVLNNTRKVLRGAGGTLRRGNRQAIGAACVLTVAATGADLNRSRRLATPLEGMARV